MSTERAYPLNFFLAPMKPSKVPKTAGGKAKLAKILKSEDYIAEEKIDGCHYFSIGGRILSPRISKADGIPVEKTQQALHISRYLAQKLGPNTILDGEIYIPNKKAPDVVSIMGSAPDVAVIKQKDSEFVHYKVFDILRLPNGNWIHELPWYKRRQYLEQLFYGFTLEHVILNDIHRHDKEKLLDELLSMGREGIVLKHIKLPYVFGKRPAWNWVKLKTEEEDDVVIMGFEPPQKIYTGKNIDIWPYWECPDYPEADVHTIELHLVHHVIAMNWIPVTKHYANQWIGSIIFGKYDATGKLVRLGTCTGIDEAQRAEFTNNSEKYIGRVMHVKLMEHTRDGAYRHCNFVRIHPDKNGFECKIDLSAR